jgi:Protein of unknown function (DUF2690)
MLGTQKILLGLFLLLFGNLAFTSKAEAACVGSQCNNRDPIEQGCTDGRIVATARYGTYSFGNWWNQTTRDRTVSLVYSDKCRANWAKVDAPIGTTIYIEEKYQPGTKRGYYTTNTVGQSYGNMSTGNVPNRSCALFPGDPVQKCTDFK